MDIPGMIHVAFSNRLSAGSPPLVARLYDLGNVPEEKVFPFVVIGEFTATDASDKSSVGFNFTQTLDIYTSGDRGKKEAEEIIAAIYTALHQSPFGDLGGSPPEAENDTLNCRFVAVTLAEDGLSIHGIMRFEGFACSEEP